MSRTAIREALRIVGAKGLIRIEKGRGIFVKDLSADTVSGPLHQYLKFKIEHNYALDVIHARQIIEPSIAAFAAVNRNDEDIEKLKDNIFRLKNNNGDNEGLTRLDMEFHMQIAYASHNQVVPLILEPIHRLMPEIKRSVYATNENAQDSAIEWHGKIVDEVIKGDPVGARSMMHQHLAIAEEHIRIMLKAQSAKN